MATAEEALKWVGKLYDVLTDRRPHVEKAFRYYEGEQPLAYASDEWRKVHRERYRDFADNWCGVVGRAPVDRLRINGFRLGSSVDVLTQDERDLMADWARADMSEQANQGFLASTIAKRSAVIVWGDENDAPLLTWEHPSQVVVAYEPGGRRRRAALKAWVDDDTEYATLFLPDEVWKWERPSGAVESRDDGETEAGLLVPSSLSRYAGGGWRPREVSGESWPMRNPLGEVPVVEWRNRPMLGGAPISDIAGTMAMQDAINLLWAYLFAAADHASMPARVVLGMEPPKVPILDDEGQVMGSKPAKIEDVQKGRLLFLPKAEKIDQWEAARLDVFTAVVRDAIGHIAAQTSTPGHYLLTSESFANLNGDALTAAEVPLATKVENQQLYYSSAAKETVALMARVRGRDDLADQIRATDALQFVQWRDAAMHSPAQVADAATKDRSIGMSLRTILERRYGMSEAEIDRELTRIEAERSDPALQAIADGLLNGNAAGN